MQIGKLGSVVPDNVDLTFQQAQSEANLIVSLGDTKWKL